MCAAWQARILIYLVMTLTVAFPVVVMILQHAIGCRVQPLLCIDLPVVRLTTSFIKASLWRQQRVTFYNRRNGHACACDDPAEILPEKFVAHAVRQGPQGPKRVQTHDACTLSTSHYD